MMCVLRNNLEIRNNYSNILRRNSAKGGPDCLTKTLPLEYGISGTSCPVRYVLNGRVSVSVLR